MVRSRVRGPRALTATIAAPSSAVALNKVGGWLVGRQLRRMPAPATRRAPSTRAEKARMGRRK